MDEMINAVDEQQEIENKPKWYEGVSLEDAKAIIKANITTAARSFIAIGYYLKHIRDKQLYLEDGHASIWEFAQAEYGISKSTASRYMTMNDRFSEGGNSPNIAVPYQGFGKSQLQEMLSLNDEQLEQVTPDMKVMDIRSLGSPESQEDIQVDGQIEISEFPEYLPPDMLAEMELKEMGYADQAPISFPKITGTLLVEDMINADQAEQSIAISQQEDELEEPEESLPDERWNIGDLPQAKDKYVRNLARVFVEKMGSQLVLASFGNIPSDEVIKGKIKDLDRRENGVEIEEGIMSSVGAELIEFFRGGEDFGVCSFTRFGTQVRKALEEWQKKESDTSEPEDQEVEKKAEEVIDGEFTVIEEPESGDLTDLQIAQEELERAQNLLNKCLKDVPDENNVHIRGMKLKVAALASLVCEIDDIENPPPKPEQPELPTLKNNDQRAAFVDNFETWPLWIETEETGERYYRYDLDDGTSMVVKVYHAMLFNWKGGLDDRYTEGYGRHEYYLLEPGKFFRDCDANRSALIEKLKEIQKKVIT